MFLTTYFSQTAAFDVLGKNFLLSSKSMPSPLNVLDVVRMPSMVTTFVSCSVIRRLLAVIPFRKSTSQRGIQLACVLLGMVRSMGKTRWRSIAKCFSASTVQ